VSDRGDLLVIRQREEGDDCIIEASGEIDVHTAGDLESGVRAALDRGVKGVGLGLEQVTFIDSSGLRALVSAHRAAGEAGSRLFLRSPSKAVVRLLELTGLSDMFPVED
jgi:anti-sigma B factor antagonist